MALIVCPECGNKISEYSKACIHCGCPMDVIKKLLTQEKPVTKTNKDNFNYPEVFTEKDVNHLEPVVEYIFSKNSNIRTVLYSRSIGFRFKGKKSSFLLVRKNKKCTSCRIKIGTRTKTVRLNKGSSEEIIDLLSQIPIFHKTKLVKKTVKESKPIVKKEIYKKIEDEIIEKPAVETIDKPIFKKIISHIKYSKASISTEEDRIANEVAKFVNKIVGIKAVEQKYFDSIEEFEKNKFYYRYIANFYGYIFSMKSVSIKDAKVFYSYFVSVKLLDLLKEYEKIFNSIIVSDYNLVLQQLSSKIFNENLNLSSLNGLSSAISNIPDKTIFDLISSYSKYVL